MIGNGTRKRWSHARRTVLLAAMLVLAGCQANLYGHLDEQQANRMIAELDRHGIDAKKTANKDDTFTLRVSRRDFAQSVTLLDAAALPGQANVSLKDILQGGGLVATPTQERAQLMYALAGELSQTIGTIDGVINARVHVVLPESDPLKRTIVPSSAAVFIRHLPGMAINPLVPRIKTLVADSVAGLHYERVSVTTVAAAASAQPAAGRRYANVLGIDVAPASRTLATLLLSTLLMVLLGIGGMLVYLIRQRRRGARFLVPSDTHAPG